MPDFPSALAEALAGHYRLERRLGAGGMATVYLAHDLKHDRPVALKVLAAELAADSGTGRFTREIRLAARLQHPHICPVHDSGESGGICWFTMPYIEGESLDARLEREGPLPLAEALRIAREAAQALAYAHGQGVIHRDIKPGNLLLTRDGSTLVADFGIARAVGSPEDVTLTEPGHAPGTPAYMSPEQRAADQLIDARTDIYSLGVVLYEMLVGERPFPGGGLDAMMAQLMTDGIPRVSLRRREIPPAVDALLARALAADLSLRIATMAAFGEELDRLRATGPEPAGWLARMTGALRGLLRARQAEVVPATTPAGRNSVAVLPFRDLSSAQDQAYFGDGLAEELTTALSRIPGLKLAGRNSAFRFRGPSVDPREVGRTLGVGVVVGGSVRRSGDRLRVGAQLTDVTDGFELWAESYDREMADVFRVQEEIARAIAGALQVQLMGASAAPLAERPTADLVAYDFFLQGRFAWHQRTAQTLPEAARCFEEAVRRDPAFARAWAGLADSCILLPFYTGDSPAEAWPRARAAAERAIALAPGLADAHTSLAYGTMLYDWHWEKAEASFRAAIAANPEYQIAHHWYADFLAGRGRLEESLAEMLRARELDPLSRITAVETGWIYHLLRRHDEAEACLAQVLRLDPSYAHGHLVLGMIRLAQGRAAEAVRVLERSVELGGFNAHTAAALIAAQAAAGDRAGAAAGLEALTARSGREYVPPFAFAIAHASLGDPDQAFAAIERGIAERDVLLPENFFEPLLDPLVGDPRYGRIRDLISGRAWPPEGHPSG